MLPVPRCADCGAVLKPDVVMFGELLPVEAIERATDLAREVALLLVVGSSLQVWPVAGLPDEALRAGGRLAIVNRESTPYDNRAALVRPPSARALLAEVRAWCEAHVPVEDASDQAGQTRRAPGVAVPTCKPDSAEVRRV
jgi:NAD-dependent SIR2 family protein deacetylase